MPRRKREIGTKTVKLTPSALLMLNYLRDDHFREDSQSMAIMRAGLKLTGSLEPWKEQIETNKMDIPRPRW